MDPRAMDPRAMDPRAMDPRLLEEFIRERIHAAAESARANPDRGDLLFPRSQLTTTAYQMLQAACLAERGDLVSWTHEDGVRFVHVTFSGTRVLQFEEERCLRKSRPTIESVLDSVGRESRRNGIMEIPDWARAVHKDNGRPDPRNRAAFSPGAVRAADMSLGSRVPAVWQPSSAACIDADGGAGTVALLSHPSAPRKVGVAARDASSVVRPTGLSKKELDVWARRQRKALRAFLDCGAVAGGAGERRGDDGVVDMAYKNLDDELRSALQKQCGDLKLGHVTRREMRRSPAGDRVDFVDLVTRHPPRVMEFAEETERQRELGPLLTEAPSNGPSQMHGSEMEEVTVPTPAPAPVPPTALMGAEEYGAWPARGNGMYPTASPGSLPGPRARAWPDPRAGASSGPRTGGLPDQIAGGLPDPRDQPLEPGEGQSYFPPTPPRERCSLDFWHDYKHWVHEQGDDIDQFIHHILREMLLGYAVSADSKCSPLELLPGLLHNPEQVLEIVGRLPQRVISAEHTDLIPERLSAHEEEIMDGFWDVCIPGLDTGFISPRPT